MPYDPSSRKVLLWKGTIVARLMHDAGLSDQKTALSKNFLARRLWWMMPLTASKLPGRHTRRLRWRMTVIVSKLLAMSQARMSLSLTPVTPAAAAMAGHYT